MTFIFILGYPNPRKGALRGGGLGGLNFNPHKGPLRGGWGGLQGVLSPILLNIMCFVNSGRLWKGGLK